MQRFERSLSLIVVVLVVVFAATVSIDVLWKGGDGKGWKNVIRSDALGYYGYLTAIFIRNDLGNEPFATEYVHRTPTGTLNKYFCGTALFMAPWFAIGHDMALGDPKAPRDGFSRYEMKAISMGAWLYLLLGLLAFRSILLRMGIRDEVVAWLLLMVAAGSTLLQYAAVQPGWSHIHTFFAVCVFFWSIQRVALGSSPWLLIVSAVSFGSILLIRPVNGLVLIGLPVVLGNCSIPFLRRLLTNWKSTLAAILVLLAVVFIQPVSWHLQTGNWFEWGYRNEGFHWSAPQVLNVLFSFRRGLFLWTPLLFLAALSILPLWKQDRTRATWALLYWCATVYVISAWWIWYYGSGFGSRVFIDHYPVMLIPLALVLQRLPRLPWFLTRVVFVLLLGLHLAQFTQYHLEIIHHEHMDREKYVHTFLKFDPEMRGALGGKWEVPPYAPNGLEPILQAATDLEREDDFWRAGWPVQDERAFSGSHVHAYDGDDEFGITFIGKAGELPTGRELWLEVRLMRYEELPGASQNAIARTTIQRSDDSFVFEQSFPMNYLPGTLPFDWSAMEYRIPVPALKDGEELRFFIWNKDGRAKFLLDDLFMRVWAVKPYAGPMRPANDRMTMNGSGQGKPVGPAGFEPATKGL